MVRINLLISIKNNYTLKEMIYNAKMRLHRRRCRRRLPYQRYRSDISNFNGFIPAAACVGAATWL